MEFLENQSWYGQIDESPTTSSKVPIMGEEDADEKQEEFKDNFGQGQVGRNKGKHPQSLMNANNESCSIAELL